MDQEELEMNEIDNEAFYVEIGKKKIKLRYPMRAWKRIKKEFGGFDKITEGLSSDPIEFITEKFPALVCIGLDDKDITEAEITELLDDCDISQMKNKIIPAVMSAMTGTMPNVDKAEKKGNPQKAGKK